MTTQGPNNPSVAVNDPIVGNTDWGNPQGIYTGATASIGISMGGTDGIYGYSHLLKATGFGFSIPSGSTINGILVEIRKYMDGDSVWDSNIYIVKNGIVQTPQNKSIGAGWPSTPTYVSYGGITDLWGVSWTPADINNSGFGAGIGVSLYCDEFGTDHADAYVNNIRITVYYTAPALTPTPSPTIRPTPSPTPTIIPTPSPTPTIIPTPSPTPTIIPTPTPSPTPTRTPTPTPTPCVSPKCNFVVW